MSGTWRACALTTLASLFVANVAHAAPAKADCVTAHEGAQRFRVAGRLRAARTELLLCASAACPPAVIAECVPWLAEVERALPTVVFEARRADGSDAADVTVLVDGARVEGTLEGRAVALDPGSHLVRFAVPGSPAIDRRVILAEGEKARIVRVEVPLSESNGGTTTATSSGPVSWTTYLFGGASVLSLGGFAVFGLSGLAGEHGLSDCSPRCPPSRIDPVHRDYVIADVLLGTSVVAAIATVVIALTSR